MSGGLFAGYPAPATDEAVTAEGRLRPGYAGLEPVLTELGAGGLAAAARSLAAVRAARGVVLGSWSDGRHERHPVVLDPLPRLIPAEEWRLLAAGVEQRHRALGAFLADAYRAAGRRRSDVDRAPEIVRAGVLPEWAVVRNPARDPGAVGQAWPGQPRVTVGAVDLVRTAEGGWMVTADDLRTPAGLGFAVEDRLSLRAAVPELFAAGPPGHPAAALTLLRQALAEAAPPACPGPPRVAVLSGGETDPSWFEHAVLAEALGVPLVRTGDLWPRADGGLEIAVDGARRPVDVLYRRFDEGGLAAYRTPVGQPLDVQLTEAVRAGRLGLANVPGNGVADDATTFAWVPAMIGFYLGEQPLLPTPRTWVLADPAALAEVRGRLHELTVEEVAGYGGRDAVDGRTCGAAELARLGAAIDAAPHRFVAREPVEEATLPAFVDGALRPRRARLRVFSVASGGGVRALPAPWTRVELGAPVAGSKDTWLLP
ncbi:circularly permuted type 2 ATP-grasp protein [Blastococcus goldschmidtiae]|uniref:Circularly permuted type 2 ATP-grasp protein n=1 Tax=Blastococcus goldschmidtiae TaxID=3075546 RepID=A0ABU2K6I1_9ACTN|nr:circularly permuted type 2 ATP-grasp protein [Blastococcus sp. DSM 46792]MDT0275777.1 circularly permuted type 2 ATP-grasp protein [Blastococcus sp. DSM 46792]